MVKIVSSNLPFAPVAAALVLAFFPGGSSAGIDNGHFVVEQSTGFAADGYDPVAYFVDQTARAGLPDYEASWMKVTWRFLNEGNRDAFLKDPYVYAPQYGGHCPVALSRGFPAEGSPRTWAIHDERLYFFFSEESLEAFEQDPEAVLTRAEATWNELFPY
jgi:YHS domain-containing protein